MSFGHQRSAPRPARMQSQLDTKMSFYQTDGSGRDYYIALEQSKGRYEPTKVARATGLADGKRDLSIINHLPTGKAQELSPEVLALVKAVPRHVPSGDAVVDELRRHLIARGGRSGLRGLHRTLRLLDGNGERALDRAELQQGLKTYGIHTTPQNMDDIVRRFGGSDGGVSVTSLINALRAPMNQRRGELVQSAFGLLSAVVGGAVTFAHMKHLCDTTQHPEVLSSNKTPQQVTAEFVQGWDKDGDAEVTEADFFDYYDDVSTGIDNDDYFELLMRNAWHLSGGEGACANTTCRKVIVVHSDGHQTPTQVPNDLGVSDRDVDEIRYRLELAGFTDINTVLLNSRIDPSHNKLTAQPKPKAPTPFVPPRELRDTLDKDRTLATLSTAPPPNMWRTTNKDMFKVQEPDTGLKLPTPTGYTGHRPGKQW